MNIATQKQNVLKFIFDHFDDNAFQRYLKYNEDEDGFVTYDDFQTVQRSIINRYDDASFATIELLMRLISIIDIMDKESMGAWPSSGFLFKRNGRIVIFHER